MGGEAPHLFEGLPGPPGPARPQKRTPKTRPDLKNAPPQIRRDFKNTPKKSGQTAFRYPGRGMRQRRRRRRPRSSSLTPRDHPRGNLQGDETATRRPRDTGGLPPEAPEGHGRAPPEAPKAPEASERYGRAPPEAPEGHPEATRRPPRDTGGLPLPPPTRCLHPAAGRPLDLTSCCRLTFEPTLCYAIVTQTSMISGPTPPDKKLQNPCDCSGATAASCSVPWSLQQVAVDRVSTWNLP